MQMNEWSDKFGTGVHSVLIETLWR